MRTVGIFLLFVLLLPPSIVSASEGDTIVDIKKDFGALGDGKHNDHQAFMDASSFLNERKGHATLTIPSGTYIVGRQLEYGKLVPLAYRHLSDEAFTNPYFRLGLPVITLSGCRDVSIVAQPGAILSFEPGLFLGTFDAEGKAIPVNDKQGKTIVAQQSAAATVGDCIYIENSRGINISGLEIDGNAAEVTFGGYLSVDGWQWGQTGIALVDVSDCHLSDMKVHHCAVDGLQLRNMTGSSISAIEDQGIVLSDCKFEFNGRQAFSWTGGAGLRAQNCSFSHTGQVFNKSLKRSLSIAPGAGLDIEPESDPELNNFRMIKNGTFSHCVFENNAGVAMVADLHDASEFRVARNIRFDSCTFWGVNNWSIWVTHPGFVFHDCDIYGSVVHSYAGKEPGMETRFTNCRFSDKPYKTSKGKLVPTFGNYLVEISDGIRTTFDSCTFTAKTKRFYYLVSSEPTNEKCNFIVRSCTFINASGSDYPTESVEEGVKFARDNRHLRSSVSE